VVASKVIPSDPAFNDVFELMRVARRDALGNLRFVARMLERGLGSRFMATTARFFLELGVPLKLCAAHCIPDLIRFASAAGVPYDRVMLTLGDGGFMRLSEHPSFPR
jgi:hypothetical protein